MAEKDPALAAYEAQKTGDPIGDADLREQLGVAATPEEEDKLTEQQVQLMTSPNIMARERFEQSSHDAPPTPGHAEDFAKFQADMNAALVDRDPVALANARQAMGLTTTAADVNKLSHPTMTDILGAERQAQLTGIPLEGTVLQGQHDTLQGELNKAYIDHNQAAFVHARDLQGMTTTPADIAKFDNPSPADVLGVARQDALLGIPVPDNSALAQQVSNILQGAPTHIETTHTQDDDPPASTGPVAFGGGTGTGTATGTGTGTGTSTGSSPGNTRSDFPTPDSGGSHSAPAANTPDAGGAPAQVAPDTAAAPAAPADTGNSPSPIDAGLANLQGGTPSEPDRGATESKGNDVGSTTGLSLPGGVGTHSDGVPAATSGPQITVEGDDEGMEATQYQPGALGYIWQSDGSGHSTAIDPNTAAPVANAGPPQASTGEENTNTGTTNNDSTTSTSSTASTSTESTSTESTETTDTTSNDDSSSTAMTNPDAATVPTGFAAGLAVPVAISTGFGSSTHGGATDGVRGDLSTGLDPITGELVMKSTATPDVAPDFQAPSGGTDVYHSSTGIGAVDGVRPDLDNGANLGPIGPPTNDGVNPYATGDGRGSSSFAATAADSSTQASAGASGTSSVVNVGSSSGGVHSAADDAAAGAAGGAG